MKHSFLNRFTARTGQGITHFMCFECLYLGGPIISKSPWKPLCVDVCVCVCVLMKDFSFLMYNFFVN